MALTKEEERQKRIKKLRDKFEYKSDQLVKNEGWHGKDRLARIKENKAIQDAVKAYDRKGSKKREQGSKYEAQSAAGTAKSSADRERHMKLVLGDDWKPSDEGRLNRDRVLAKMDKRNRALDPENDPEMFSTLRNKLNINPTNAEVERRLMARGNAGREQSRLSEGEAGGAVAGSAAERIREARKVREATQRDEDFQRKRHEGYQKFRSGRGALEVAREPTVGGLEDLGTESLRERVNKDARVKDYKDFSDEAALIGRERAMSGEGGITQAEDSEQALKEALPFARAAERKKYGGVGSKMLEERHQREKGLMNMGGLPPSERAKLESAEAGGERMDFDDPSIAGRGSWRGKEEELGGKSMPFTEAMKEEQGGKSLDLNEKENRELLSKIDPEKAASLEQGDIDKQMTEGMAQDEVERAVNEEFTGEMNQEDAQQAIRDSSPEDQKEISSAIEKEKGMGSPEWVESKEATGNYVSYEGSGLVINMASLGKDIQRNRNMEMLKHIPAANRPAMLVEWGYIDKGDLSIAQKQSAKELKELSLLDLRIAETQGKIEKNKNSMGEKQKLQYTAATKGMQQAIKDGQWSTAEVYRNELNSIMPTGDTSNFQELIDKGIKRGKIKTPQKVFTAAGLGKDGKEYYKSKRSIVEKVNFLRTSKGTARTSELHKLLGTTMGGEGGGEGVTYGSFLTSQGIPAWKKVKGQTEVGNVPKWALKNEESYMSWALPQIEDKLMIGIWGNVHTQVNDLNMKQYRKAQKNASDEVIRMRQPWEMGEDEGKVDPALKKAAGGRRTTPSANLSPTSSEPIVEPTAFTGTSEEASSLIKQKQEAAKEKRVTAANKKYRTKYQNLVNKNEWERFEEETVPTMSAMSKEELEDTLKVFGDNVKRKSATGQRTGFDEMTLEYIRTLLKNK